MIERYTVIKYASNGWTVTTFTENEDGVLETDELFLSGESDSEPNKLCVDFLYELADILGIEMGSKHSKKRLKISLVDAEDFFDNDEVSV